MIDANTLLTLSLNNSNGMLIFYVLMIIGQWKVFEKAGEEGWKSIIPFYNFYILWKIADKKYIRFIIITTILFVSSTILSAFSIASSSGAMIAASGILMLIALIYVLTENAGFCKGLSESFGHGTAFAIGLFFFQPIFLMILGFNSDVYQKKS